jgi:hypothetical protein
MEGCYPIFLVSRAIVVITFNLLSSSTQKTAEWLKSIKVRRRGEGGRGKGGGREEGRGEGRDGRNEKREECRGGGMEKVTKGLPGKRERREKGGEEGGGTDPNPPPSGQHRLPHRLHLPHLRPGMGKTNEGNSVRRARGHHKKAI